MIALSLLYIKDMSMDKLDNVLFRVLIGLVVFILFFSFGTAVFAQEEAVNPNLIEQKVETTSTVTTNGNTTTTLKSPPASAVAPTINTSNSDLCTFGVAGAVQTQILGISTGTQFTDENCERLKNSKTLYDMGMKVAAVSLMCQDERVFDAMMNAGTPCPYDGLIGDEAKAAWMAVGDKDYSQPNNEEGLDEQTKNTAAAGGGVAGLLALLLLL
jgi:hypothetical protein